MIPMLIKTKRDEYMSHFFSKILVKGMINRNKYWGIVGQQYKLKNCATATITWQ